MICMGMNPAVGGPNSHNARKGLGKLKWLVTVDLWETETSIFWKRPGVNPREIKTEVFMLPAAASMEKEGSISNSGRWAQWRYKAVEPPGEAKSDLWIIDQFHKRLKSLYEKEGGQVPRADSEAGLGLWLRPRAGRAPGGPRDKRLLHAGHQRKR